MTSWEQQGAIELTKLAEDFSTSSEVLLLGDFNVGPEIPPSVVADMPGKCNRSCVMRNHVFAYAKPKAQISCVLAAQLISTFVFATSIYSIIPLLPKSKITSI